MNDTAKRKTAQQHIQNFALLLFLFILYEKRSEMIVWACQRLGTWMLHLMVDTSCRESLVHTLIVTSFLYFVACMWRWWRTSLTLPPGPRGLPLVGYLPYIRRDFHEELTLLSKQHGPIFSLRMGSELIVVLSDHKVIREAFRREEFACRPDNDFMKLLDGYGKSESFSLLSRLLHLSICFVKVSSMSRVKCGRNSAASFTNVSVISG